MVAAVAETEAAVLAVPVAAGHSPPSWETMDANLMTSTRPPLSLRRDPLRRDEPSDRGEWILGGRHRGELATADTRRLVAALTLPS